MRSLEIKDFQKAQCMGTGFLKCQGKTNMVGVLLVYWVYFNRFELWLHYLEVINFF